MLGWYLWVSHKKPLPLSHLCHCHSPVSTQTMHLIQRRSLRERPASSTWLVSCQVNQQLVHTCLCSILRSTSPGSFSPIVGHFYCMHTIAKTITLTRMAYAGHVKAYYQMTDLKRFYFICKREYMNTHLTNTMGWQAWLQSHGRRNIPSNCTKLDM